MQEGRLLCVDLFQLFSAHISIVCLHCCSFDPLPAVSLALEITQAYIRVHSDQS